MILGRALYQSMGHMRSAIKLLSISFLRDSKRLLIRGRKRDRTDQSQYKTRKLLCDSEGNIICDACGLCSVHCPTGTINVVSDGNDGVKTFEINDKKCIGCGLCVEACPIGAIGFRGTPAVAKLGSANPILDKEKLTYFLKNSP